jgi:gamma-glutamyl-gamma-aminobutyrate hydrolase PuuD
LDEKCGRAHIIELKDPERWVLGVLFHPERTKHDEEMRELIPSSLNITKAFVEQSQKYKLKK